MFEAIDSLVHALHKGGVEEVIICPGSRNAPLTISFIRSNYFQNHSVADERSAGFIALGKAIKSKKPVALLCTSGSALTNFYPALVEAFYQRVPLIILSADRPERLIDSWDGQTIVQNNIFGKHVKGSFCSSEDYSTPKSFFGIAEEALNLALGGNPGPVHINIPLTEPLYPEPHRVYIAPGKVEFHKLEQAKEEVEVPDLSGKRVLVIRGFDWKSKGKTASYKAQFSDLMSGFINTVIPEQLFMIKDPALLDSIKPEVILSDGAAILSKQIKQFLRGIPELEQYHFSEEGHIADPFFTKPKLIKSDLDKFIEESSSSWDLAYAQRIVAASEEIVKAHLTILNEESSFNEFTANQYLLNKLEKEAVLHVANSMPVRFASLIRPEVSKVYCNRGTSGIDGCVSTALGIASQDERQHYLLVGDIAFFYDSNALWNSIAKKNFKIILQNNGGGGIFRLIDGPSQQPELDQFFETSHSREARELCMNLNCHYFRAEDQTQLEYSMRLFQEIEGPALFEIVTNKVENQSFFNQYKEKINAVKISLGNHSRI